MLSHKPLTVIQPNLLSDLLVMRARADLFFVSPLKGPGEGSKAFGVGICDGTPATPWTAIFCLQIAADLKFFSVVLLM